MKAITLILALLALSLSHGSAAEPTYAVVGQRATLSVTSDGTVPLNYQWRKDGVAIPGATAAVYVIASIVPSDAGNYTCHVSNKAGAVLSDVAPLYVITPPTRATTAAKVETPAGGAVSPSS